MNPNLIGTEVAERASIEQLVRTFQETEEAIRQSFARIRVAMERLNAEFAGSYTIALRGRHESYVNVDWSDPKDQIRELRRSAWSVLIARTEVRKAMSIAAWRDLDGKITKEEPPEVTVENVEGMLLALKADIPKMLEAAVHEVFDFLRPHSSRYKTNTEFELGERVVMSGWVTPGWWKGADRDWTVDHHYEQYMIALENVFAMLEGRVRKEGDGYFSELSTTIKACHGKPECHGETPLFEFRGYKNRNLHLRFKRMDLVKKLNAVAGGARLKPSAAAT